MQLRVPPSPSNSEFKWVQTPRNLQLAIPYLLAKAVRPLPNNQIQYTSIYENKPIAFVIDHQKAFESSNGVLYDDMCEMAILNQPQVLNNIIKRYLQDQIFTYIGPTLIVVNPYKLIDKFFSTQAITIIRDKILNDKFDRQPPHVYMIAGKAYKSMLVDQAKQAIVISGQSGAGKTQSAKYCMQLLTALSHKSAHPIETKILACNPLLQAFGNSKTIRNDNSSRFGKYVKIFFSGDNIIKGATINSYLLQKSRVTSISPNQRSFHIFYAVAAAGIQGLLLPQQYNYLSQSNCYTSSHSNDKTYFNEISSSMDSIGFGKNEQAKIWRLLASILTLGNIQFDDAAHLANQSNSCIITNGQYLQYVAKNIGVEIKALEKVLLFERRKFLKEVTSSPYNKNKCIANRNTLSKAIYNTIFEFILYKVQISLRPQQNQNYKSISILDIFGFQNFTDNNFQQLCINFTNERLLKLYNQYVFERELQLLREDGLDKQLTDIIPPTNDNIINTISGKLSLFSIINDLTMPQQYKDMDMIAGFSSKLQNTDILQFDKLRTDKFLIKHSQCDVIYSVIGFKVKNQDKVIVEIEEIVNELFEHQNRDNIGKTLIDKLSKDIESLMKELEGSKVNFIRCIKPNQKKMPGYPEQQYILSQVRYLGVFQTIQIRKKTFPSRKTYQQFYDMYSLLFPNLKEKRHKQGTIQILKIAAKDTKAYLLGNLRVYVNNELQNQLDRKLYKLLKVKNDKAIVIQRWYKRWKFRRTIKGNLKVLVSRIRIWRQIGQKNSMEIQSQVYAKIKSFVEEEKQKYILEQSRLKKQKEQQQKQLRKSQIAKRKGKIPQKLKSSIPIFNKIIKACALKAIKQIANVQQDTIVLDQIVPSNEEPNLNINSDIQKLLKNKLMGQIQTSFQMNASFLLQKSAYISNKGPDSVFKRTMTVGFFNKERLISPELQRLRLILAEKYKPEMMQNEEDYFSPNSEDCTFKIQGCEPQALKSIIKFPASSFLKSVLRRRTNFIGMSKSEDEILTAKPRAMSKSLTILIEEDEKQALQIFKILVKIGQQSKLQNVFKLIQSMVELCKGTSQQLKNEVFLMMIKQSNASSQLISVRIFQCLAVFLHIHSPNQDFLYTAMNIFFRKLGQQKLTQKEQQYIRYLFKKMLRIIQRPFAINYMPVKYQLMALMCKRQISLPVYLPVGNSILIRVESYHTFADIKVQVMQDFGIDHKRLNPQYFTFFEIVNFESEELGESPLNQNQVVWDVMTYWERSKEKYKQAQIIPPAFFLMLKVRYCFQCLDNDEESIQILFSQCYFDYFIGRIKLDVQKMAILAACVKKIKLIYLPIQDITGAYPAWIVKCHKKDILTQLMRQSLILINQEKLNDCAVKYKFLTIAEECPLTLSLAIPTEQTTKLFFKPKIIYLTQKCIILHEFSIRTVFKWVADKEQFVVHVKTKEETTSSYIVKTTHAHICSGYLSLIPKLIMKNEENQPILKSV